MRMQPEDTDATGSLPVAQLNRCTLAQVRAEERLQERTGMLINKLKLNLDITGKSNLKDSFVNSRKDSRLSRLC